MAKPSKPQNHRQPSAIRRVLRHEKVTIRKIVSSACAILAFSLLQMPCMHSYVAHTHTRTPKHIYIYIYIIMVEGMTLLMAGLYYIYKDFLLFHSF